MLFQEQVLQREKQMRRKLRIKLKASKQRKSKKMRKVLQRKKQMRRKLRVELKPSKQRKSKKMRKIGYQESKTKF